jgi:hypothetical protein
MGFESFQVYGPRRGTIVLRERVMVSPLSSHLARSRSPVQVCVPYILNASHFEFRLSIKLKVRARRSLRCFFSTLPGEVATRTNLGAAPSLGKTGRRVVYWIAMAKKEFTVSIEMIESIQL